MNFSFNRDEPRKLRISLHRDRENPYRLNERCDLSKLLFYNVRTA